MVQIITGHKSTGGVLQIPASATQKHAHSASRPKSTRTPQPRLKLIVRRLPPGLTATEFEICLGEEWKLGAGRVDWYQYKPGKVSKDPAKPSRPSRAYIHVLSQEYITPLSEKLHQTPFVDARHTYNDPVLLGPPSLEFAPFAKLPSSRVRKDVRLGTIDQESDFISFLESLTLPITKPAPVDTLADGADEKDAVTVTPLVQYIKDKKANKAKEAKEAKEIASIAKPSKHESQPEEKVQAKKVLLRSDRDVPLSPKSQVGEDKGIIEKAAKEAVKAANKQAATLVGKSVAAKPPSSSSTGKDTTPASGPAPERKRERGRGTLTAAAKIVQRDLGLSPATGRRRGARPGSPGAESTKTERKNEAPTPLAEPNKKETVATKSAKSDHLRRSKPNTPQVSTDTSHLRSSSAAGAATTPKPAQVQSKPPRTSRNKPVPTPQTPVAASTSTSATPLTPTSASTTTQAFLKHANPSQGVTEPLLEKTFSQFGTVVKVEIDKKKGFGYVDFAEPDGLQKAIVASPVSVAQSQVVVLERKLNPSAERSRGKGRPEPPSPNGGGNAVADNFNNVNQSRDGRSTVADEAAAGAGRPSGPRRGGRNPRHRRGSGGKSAATSNSAQRINGRI